MIDRTYILQVGGKGSHRLDIQNNVLKQSSESLLQKAGDLKDKVILEVGCGIGNMTCWLAEQIGQNGHLYALDISESQINIAKSRILEKGLKNTTFIVSSINELSTPIKFDIIYSRLLFMHIKNPFHALSATAQLLNKEGILICEEACDSISCYPPLAAYTKSRELLKQLANVLKIDLNIGEKLPSYFNQLNLEIKYTNYTQPIYKCYEEKTLVPLFIKEAKEKYLAYSLASESIIDNICDEIFEYIRNDNTLLSFPRIMQIIGKRN